MSRLERDAFVEVDPAASGKLSANQTFYGSFRRLSSPSSRLARVLNSTTLMMVQWIICIECELKGRSIADWRCRNTELHTRHDLMRVYSFPPQ